MSRKEAITNDAKNFLQMMCGDCGRTCPMTHFQNAKHTMICEECFNKLPADQRHDMSTAELIFGQSVRDYITLKQALEQLLAKWLTAVDDNRVGHARALLKEGWEQAAKVHWERKIVYELCVEELRAVLSGPTVPKTPECEHEWVMNMIHMPQGYEKPGSVTCSKCGAFKPPAQITIGPAANKEEPCDLECGDRIFKGVARCRHGRTPDEMLSRLLTG